MPSESLRRAGFQAAAAALALGVVLFAVARAGAPGGGCGVADAVSGRVDLERHAGQREGQGRFAALTIQARLVGNRAPVIAQVQIADGDRWRVSEMTSDAAGAFRLAMPSVSAPFKYRVVAGAVTSPTYEIAVAIPPRVTRIDVHYTYPAGSAAAAADRDRRRRYLCAGRHRRPRRRSSPIVRRRAAR